ncbi:MAG: CAP domain-containing protein [Planctomycetota bacterium]|nr:CAP domain-containing protein [Planctomycetota bacterium]
MRRPLRILPAFFLAALAACGVGGIDGSSESKFDTPPGESMTAQELAMALEVLDRVNHERAVHGLEPVAWDSEAADAAYDHCVDMRLRGYYAHVSPEMRGGCERMRDGGVHMDLCVGENLARHNESPASVVAAWMGSPSHREIMLSPYATHVGIGVHTGRGGPWWAQEFLARR